MKKIAIFTAVFIFILLLTKIADDAPPQPLPGYAFSLKAQRVIECSPSDITLVDTHQAETHLDKDGSWPGCADFQSGRYYDFYLSRGEKTRFLRDEQTVWWRRDM